MAWSGSFAVTSRGVFLAPKQKEWLFTYSNSSSNVDLSFGSDESGMQMIVNGVSCDIESIISSSDITSSMKHFCLFWTSSNGQVGIHFDGNYRTKTCSTSMGRFVPGGGQFWLGGELELLNSDGR